MKFKRMSMNPIKGKTDVLSFAGSKIALYKYQH